MRTAPNPKIRLAVVATFLLFIAIPISIVGTNAVNDLRNRASETASGGLHFVTDFAASQITQAYAGIPYENTIAIAGDNAGSATLQLGCDVNKCGSDCEQYTQQNNPPSGFLLLNDPNMLVWETPEASGTTKTWPIVVSAYAPIAENSTQYECAIASFDLTLIETKKNQAPSCQVDYPQAMTQVPLGNTPDFTLLATDYDDGLAEAQVVLNENGQIIDTLTWDISDQNEVFINKDSDPALTFSLEELGNYTITAQVTDKSGQRTTCSMPDQNQINVVIPGDNGSPYFTTDPYTQSTPSTNITVGDNYSYTFEATDDESDIIDYFIINETGWLNFTLNENTPGHISGTLSGIPTASGSYTAVVALNDGQHNHYTTQIWVINVNSAENDTPVVTVTSPTQGQTYTQGQNMTIAWSASDMNQIVQYDVYLSANPSNESTWLPISTGLGYNYGSYVWPVNVATPGTYFIVVTATDNQNPAARGIGISGAFVVNQGQVSPTPEPEPGTTIPEDYPQITDIKPINKSTITETKPIISATLKASTNSKIDGTTVKITLDDKDITSSADIRGNDSAEGSILYTPDMPLAEGGHKVSVSFEDSSDKVAQKTWTFTIGTTDQQQPSTTSDTFRILGFEIPRRTALIIAIGLVLILLGLIIPWLFYAAWKRSQDEEEYYSGGRSFSGPMPKSPLQTAPATTTRTTTTKVIAPAPIKTSKKEVKKTTINRTNVSSISADKLIENISNREKIQKTEIKPKQEIKQEQPQQAPVIARISEIPAAPAQVQPAPAPSKPAKVEKIQVEVKPIKIEAPAEKAPQQVVPPTPAATPTKEPEITPVTEPAKQEPQKTQEPPVPPSQPESEEDEIKNVEEALRKLDQEEREPVAVAPSPESSPKPMFQMKEIKINDNNQKPPEAPNPLKPVTPTVRP